MRRIIIHSMKALIVEDDLVSRLLLHELLKDFGDIDEVGDGREAVQICNDAIDKRDYYNLICLDIMMPEMDGKEALKHIREMEEASKISFDKRSKIVMITALGDVGNVMESYYELCDGYLVKPFTQKQLDGELKRLELI